METSGHPLLCSPSTSSFSRLSLMIKGILWENNGKLKGISLLCS